MKKTNFFIGVIASIMLIVIYIGSMVSAICDGGSGSGGQRAIMFVLLILAFVLLWLTYRARIAQTIANGVWTIVIGAACGFFPVGFTVMMFYTHHFEPVLVGVICSLSTFAIIARGIMTLVSKKKPYMLDDFDRGAVVRERNAGSISGAVLALVGGLANALIGIITLIEMWREDLFDSSKMLDNAAFLIFILIISFVGAIVFLFNRLQGGVILIACSTLAILMLLLSMFASADIIGIILIIAQLLVLAGGLFGIRGFNAQSKETVENK